AGRRAGPFVQPQKGRGPRRGDRPGQPARRGQKGQRLAPCRRHPRPAGRDGLDRHRYCPGSQGLEGVKVHTPTDGALCAPFSGSAPLFAKEGTPCPTKRILPPAAAPCFGCWGWLLYCGWCWPPPPRATPTTPAVSLPGGTSCWRKAPPTFTPTAILPTTRPATCTFCGWRRRCGRRWAL